MKQGLVLALVAIVACLNTVRAALSPMLLSANFNSFAPNIVRAGFYQSGSAPNPMNFQVILPVPFNAIERLGCIYEVMIGSNVPIHQRTYQVPASIQPTDNTPNYSTISTSTYPTQNYDLGKIELVCSFFLAQNYEFSGVKALAYAWNAIDSTNIPSTCNVAPFRGFSDYVSTTLAEPNSNSPSTFIITNTNAWANGTTMSISNAAMNRGTTAATTRFSTFGQTSYCDVHWDGVKYPNSATATVGTNGVDFKFGSPINTARELIVVCQNVKGYTNVEERYRPSLLMYTSGPGQAFSIPAKVSGLNAEDSDDVEM